MLDELMTTERSPLLSTKKPKENLTPPRSTKLGVVLTFLAFAATSVWLISPLWAQKAPDLGEALLIVKGPWGYHGSYHSAGIYNNPPEGCRITQVRVYFTFQLCVSWLML